MQMLEIISKSLVGARGFEPPTPCAQGRCATRLRYAPLNTGSRERLRMRPRVNFLYHGFIYSDKMKLKVPAIFF